MKNLQNEVNAVLANVSKQGWNVSLTAITEKGRDNCDGEYIEMGAFLFFPYNKIIRPHDINWSIDDLHKVPTDLTDIVNNIKNQELMIKYQEIFNIENK